MKSKTLGALILENVAHLDSTTYTYATATQDPRRIVQVSVFKQKLHKCSAKSVECRV